MDQREDNEKIRDAEIESIDDLYVSEEDQAKKEKRKKRDFYVELILICILGFLMGVAVKTEAGKRITMGFDDYLMKIISTSYDISRLQKELLQKASLEETSAEEQSNSAEEKQAE